MKRPRISIAGIMGGVALLGVSLAALREETEAWARWMLTLALASNGLALIGGLASPRPAESAWIGFLILGGGYLGLCIGPWSDEHLMPHLATTAVIDHLYATLEYNPTRVGERVWTADRQGREFLAGETFGEVDARTVRFDVAHDRGTTSRYVAAQLRGISPAGHRRLCHSILSVGLGLLGAWLFGWFRGAGRATSPPSTMRLAGGESTATPAGSCSGRGGTGVVPRP